MSFQASNLQTPLDPTSIESPGPLYDPSKHGLVVARIHQAVEHGSGVEGYTRDQLAHLERDLPGMAFCHDHQDPVGHVIRCWSDKNGWAWASSAIYKTQPRGKQVYDDIRSGKIGFCSLKWEQDVPVPRKPVTGRHEPIELSCTHDPVERGARIVFCHSKTGSAGATTTVPAQKPRPAGLEGFLQQVSAVARLKDNGSSNAQRQPSSASKELASSQKPPSMSAAQGQNAPPAASGEKEAPAPSTNNSKKDASAAGGKRPEQQEQAPPKQEKRSGKKKQQQQAEEEASSSEDESVDALAAKPGMTPETLKALDKLKRKAQRERREREKARQEMEAIRAENASLAEEKAELDRIKAEEVKRYQEANEKYKPFLEHAIKEFKMEKHPGMDKAVQMLMTDKNGEPFMNLYKGLFDQLAEKDAQLEQLTKKHGDTARTAQNLSSLVKSKRSAAAAAAEDSDDSGSDASSDGDVQLRSIQQQTAQSNKARKMTASDFASSERGLPERSRKEGGRYVREPDTSRIPAPRMIAAHSKTTSNVNQRFNIPGPVADELTATGLAQDSFFAQFIKEAGGINWGSGFNRCVHEDKVNEMIRNKTV